MGKILPSFKKAIYEDITNQIAGNSAHYYAFAANPISYTGNTPAIDNSDYGSLFENNWQILFGKKLTVSNIVPVIDNNIWSTNTVYNIYDNTNEYLHSNSNFYVISEPDYVGGTYNVYKCIDNNNNANSTIKPTLVQSTTFQTADGYKWRYVTSITYKSYNTLSTQDYSPIYANTILAAQALSYSTVDVIRVANGGSGYSTYHNGIVAAVVNSSLIQIESSASSDNDYYTKSAIYLYNSLESTGQLFGISDYVSNTSGKWVYFDGSANTDAITPSVTNYRIAPKVKIYSDGASNPVAYCTVNAFANSIDTVIVLDSGSEISWSNVSIECNTAYGVGANLYAIVPPPGGHGADPISELDIKGLSVNFSFANTEGDTIVTSNVLYNKIGILKNPYSLNVNNGKGSTFYSNTFNQLLKLSISPSKIFDTGDYVVGVESGAIGTVALSNSTVLYLTGDKDFIDGEQILSSNNQVDTFIAIDEMPTIYSKDISPLYFENINNINRSNTQTESYNLIIQI